MVFHEPEDLGFLLQPHNILICLLIGLHLIGKRLFQLTQEVILFTLEGDPFASSLASHLWPANLQLSTLRNPLGARNLSFPALSPSSPAPYEPRIVPATALTLSPATPSGADLICLLGFVGPPIRGPSQPGAWKASHCLPLLCG